MYSVTVIGMMVLTEENDETCLCTHHMTKTRAGNENERAKEITMI
jgi:hypothetical protein